MEYFDKQILNGLEKIPTPESPGSLIVTGDSQPVFTGNSAGDVFLAACEYGNGRIFVSAHDCYLNWLNQNDSALKRDFNINLKTWLTGENVDDSEIIDLGELIHKGARFEDYKLIKWHHGCDPNEKNQNSLLRFVENGGGLFCGSTPWGYLQIYRNKKLSDMTMYNFLKQFTGIIFTTDILSLPTEMKVSENKAKHSHFDLAIERVTSKPEHINKYYNTIHNGLETLNEQGLLNCEKIVDLKNLVIENCDNCGWNTHPNEDTPVSGHDEKNAVKLLGKCFNFTDGERAPGIDDFPGDFEEDPELLEDIRIEVSSNFQERISTGYYLPASVNLLINVNSGDFKGWSIRIGAHTDDISHCDSFKRWPCITLVKDLTQQMSLCTPFGGLIYFESPKASSINVTLNNVVESPFIDLKKPETILDWERRRLAPGLWTELAGEFIIFTTPSDCIRELENPEQVIKFWDNVVKTHHECRGTNPGDYRRERVVNDKQPSCGYMHSGYPIVTHLDCCQSDCDQCIFDLEKLRPNGNWGLFHEIGHNLQRDEWTFDGCGEVTVNLFSMHAVQFVIGKEIVDQAWPRDRIPEFKKYFSKTPNYEDWKNNCGMALMTFAQLIKHFGWSAMHKFMKDYENDIKNYDHRLPKSNQDKIDQWVVRYSKIVSRNIKPQFQMFGLPVSEKVDKKLAGLEPWCPVEEKDPNVFFSKL